MSVFTTVTPEQLSAWLRNYSIGVLTDLQGILSGIENTNYFATPPQAMSVLSFSEKLPRQKLPYYLNLMAHLSSHGLPCPKPIANLQNELLGALNGKPAAIVTCLEGQPVTEPTPEHCAQVGGVLADMHLAGRTFKSHLDTLRGEKWWTACAPEIYPFLTAEDAELLESEIRFQVQQVRAGLPRGVIHADLFRDNVLIQHDQNHGDHVGGFIDFYFACVDCFIYDVGITVNDWCTNADATLDPARTQALLKAYTPGRPFTHQERDACPWM